MVSSCTPVKVKRGSYVGWMMDRSIEGAPESGRRIHSSSTKRSFVKDDPAAAAASQFIMKKAKIDTANPNASTDSAKHSESVAAKDHGSKKFFKTFGCGSRSIGSPKERDEPASEDCFHGSSSTFCSQEESSSCCSNASDTSDDSRPKIYRYSRYTTLRLRASSPNQRSPLIARQLRF